MSSDLERSMESLIVVFHRYASEQDGCHTLSLHSLKQLMKQELPGYLEAQKDPAAVDKIMKDLDTTGEGRMNFEQFFCLMAGLSIACEKAYQKKMKTKK